MINFKSTNEEGGPSVPIGYERKYLTIKFEITNEMIEQERVLCENCIDRIKDHDVRRGYDPCFEE